MQEWIALAKEKKDEILVSLMSAYRCALEWTHGGGYYASVILHEDGEVEVSGITDQNSYSMCVAEGKAIYIKKFKTTFDTWDGYPLLEDMERLAIENEFNFPDDFKEMEECDKIEVLREKLENDVISQYVNCEIEATDFFEMFNQIIRELQLST